MRGGLSLPMRRLSGTWESETAMQTEKPQVEATMRARVRMRSLRGGTSVVAEKSPIKGWSEDVVSRSLIQ
jgi:hypothetical protein